MKVLICVILGIAISWLLIQWLLWTPPNPNVERKKVIHMLQKAGGVERVNEEAQRLFREFYASSREAKFLYETDLKTFPAIASLGNSVSIYSATKEVSASIRVRYGSHWRTRFILIFDPKINPQLEKSLFVEVTNNIFIPNYSRKKQ